MAIKDFVYLSVTHCAFLSPPLSQAQLLDMRSELVEERAAKEALQSELHTMLLQLHSTQLQIHALRGIEVDSADIKRKLVSVHVYDNLPVHPSSYSVNVYMYRCYMRM